MGPVRLSVVDQSPISAGSTAQDALRNSIELAQTCERLGYHRYWVAEHHNSQGLAGSAPEILIGHIAAATSTIRVGSGGVMLTHYSPLKVAEQFKMLAALHPGRIDLGLGRAPGSDQLTAEALAVGSRLGAEHYPAQVQELRHYLGATTSYDGRFRSVAASPHVDEVLPVWMLASSEGSVAIAAHLGLPLSFAHFITMGDGPAMVDAYRRQLVASDQDADPHVTVALSVICADTGAEAEALASSLTAWRARGLSGSIPTPTEAAAAGGTSRDRRRMIAVNNGRKPLIVGDPETCRRDIDALAQAYGVDEIMAITITHSHEARVRSYELLADVYRLGGPDQPSPGDAL